MLHFTNSVSAFAAAVAAAVVLLAMHSFTVSTTIISTYVRITGLITALIDYQKIGCTPRRR